MSYASRPSGGVTLPPLLPSVAAGVGAFLIRSSVRASAPPCSEIARTLIDMERLNVLVLNIPSFVDGSGAQEASVRIGSAKFMRGMTKQDMVRSFRQVFWTTKDICNR